MAESLTSKNDTKNGHHQRASPTGSPVKNVWVMSRWWPSQFCRFCRFVVFDVPPLLRESVHQGLIVLGNMVGEQDKFSDWNQTCLITLFTLIFCYHVQLPFIPVTQASFELIQIHIRELAYLAMFLLILSGKWQTKSSNWYHSWRFYSLDRLLEEQRWVMLSDGTQTLCEESCDPLRILEYVQSKLKSTVTNNPPAISCAESNLPSHAHPLLVNSTAVTFSSSAQSFGCSRFVPAMWGNLRALVALLWLFCPCWSIWWNIFMRV